MPTFIYGNYSYQYKVIKQKRKSLALIVRPDLEIILKTPHEVEQDKIEKFLKKKWFWMSKQINFFEKIQRKKYTREYVSGESFLYLGRQYKLIVKKSPKDFVRLTRGVLEVHTTSGLRDGTYNKKVLDAWFKSRYKIIFQEQFEEMKKRFDYTSMPELAVRSMPKRWGSFLSKKKILLNPKLIHTSKDCIDYVIVHELCHMKYKNHNKQFWSFLDQKYPKWKKVKEKLEFKYGTL